MNNAFKLLGVPISSETVSEIRTRVQTILAGQEFVQIATVNPEFLTETQKNLRFKQVLQTTWNICDGSGIQYVAHWLYETAIPRIPGVDIATMLCQQAVEQNKTVFLLGSQNPNMKAVAETKFPGIRIVGIHTGTPDDAVQGVKDAKPDILLVCYAFPMQEEWIAKYGPGIPNLKIAGGFGGTFDFWAGKLHRAPRWMQTIGIEWLYRLYQEPKKRAKRIWNAVVVFLYYVIAEKLQKKS